jgi:hypothetical protein
VSRDPVGPCQDGQVCGPDGIGMSTAAGIPHGCDVVDIDAEAKGRSFHEPVFAENRISCIYRMKSYDFVCIHARKRL